MYKHTRCDFRAQQAKLQTKQASCNFGKTGVSRKLPFVAFLYFPMKCSIRIESNIRDARCLRFFLINDLSEGLKVEHNCSGYATFSSIVKIINNQMAEMRKCDNQYVSIPTNACLIVTEAKLRFAKVATQ